MVKPFFIIYKKQQLGNIQRLLIFII